MSSDGNFGMQLATALRSLVESNPHGWPFDIYVLFHDFPESMQRRVTASLPDGSVSICWMPVDLVSFERFPNYLQISKIFYSRLLIPQSLPRTIPKVLYLDADVLILQNLGPLFEVDLEGFVVAAVLDDLDPQLKRGQGGGLPRVRDYFNSGVLIMNLDLWRSESIAEQALAYLSANQNCRYPDQDALNVICDGRWKKLGKRWNYQNHYITRFADMGQDERPSIVHFVTENKPWDPTVLSPNANFYDDFRARTCFARTASQVLFDDITGLCSRCQIVLGRSWSGWRSSIRGHKPVNAASSVDTNVAFKNDVREI